MSPLADTFLQRVREALDAFDMLPVDAPVLVAVSGGADSVALAHALLALDVPIAIAHFDHQTRDGESAADAGFVEALARDLGVACFSTGRDIESEAADSTLSFEEYAREARYGFLVATAKAQGCGAIATGHHADDQAETVLMRVLRGTSTRGLAGIPPVGARDGVPLIRPLIDVSRGEILAYLRDGGFEYREDASNQDSAFVRNRIRHDLLPLLRNEYNPRVDDALVRLSRAARDENALLASLTEDFMAGCVEPNGSVGRSPFGEGHRALQRRAVLELAWRAGARPDYARVEEAVDFIAAAGSGKRFDLGGGIQLRAGAGSVAVVSDSPESLDTSTVPLRVPGETVAFGQRLRVTRLVRLPSAPLAAYCSPSRQVVDAASLTGDVAVRHRRPGDRIAPFGLGGTRKLKDYFSDLGVPPEERDEKLLVCANGSVLWIVGHAVSADAAITEATSDALEIEVVDAAE